MWYAKNKEDNSYNIAVTKLDCDFSKGELDNDDANWEQWQWGFNDDFYVWISCSLLQEKPDKYVHV